ncbi:MAG: hypothetical protein LBQ88_09825, partial [Treponema sp.]|nr:hypothetical protein [Treponema sp.]
MKIGIKLVVVITALNIIGLGLLTSVTSVLSKNQITTLVQDSAISSAEQGSEKIKNWLALYMDSSRTLAQAMARYESIPVDQRRA